MKTQAVTTTTRYPVVMADEIPEEPGIREAKAHFSDYVNRGIYRGDVVWVTKNGRRVVGIAPTEVIEAGLKALGRAEK